jgi:hypothetical protein
MHESYDGCNTYFMLETGKYGNYKSLQNMINGYLLPSFCRRQLEKSSTYYVKTDMQSTLEKVVLKLG